MTAVAPSSIPQDHGAPLLSWAKLMSLTFATRSAAGPDVSDADVSNENAFPFPPA